MTLKHFSRAHEHDWRFMSVLRYLFENEMDTLPSGIFSGLTSMQTLFVFCVFYDPVSTCEDHAAALMPRHLFDRAESNLAGLIAVACASKDLFFGTFADYSAHRQKISRTKPH